MGLNLLIPVEEIDLPGGKSTVRGLSLEDLTLLVRRHGGPLGELFKGFAQTDGVSAMSLDNMGSIVTALMEVAPAAVAEAICLAGDEPLESAAQVRRLPGPIQIEALTKISHLTFGTDGLSRALETVIQIATGTTGLLTKLRS